MQNSLTSYGNLLKRTEVVKQKLEEYYIWPKDKFGRLHRYEKVVFGLDKSLKNNTVDDYLKRNNSTGEVGFALKQLFEMVFISENVLGIFRRATEEERKQLAKRIKDVLSGPPYTKNETASNSLARNSQFELLLAARLISRGYNDVKLLENPDILVKIKDRNYAFECKRLTSQSKSAITDNVNNAITQITRNRSNDVFGRVVAVDLSSQYEKGENWLGGKSHNSAENFAQRELGKDAMYIIKNCPKLIENAKANIIVSLIVGMSCVYVLNEKPELGWINELSVCVFDKENIFRAPIFKEDFARLS